MIPIVAGVLYCVFFCSDTATTEIYTYGHTRSLHDARPIWRSRNGASTAKRHSAFSTMTAMRAPILGQWMEENAAGAARSGAPMRPRSEEHTSELQSLMRISYAVFCLKNKKNMNRHDQHTTPKILHQAKAPISTNNDH